MVVANMENGLFGLPLEAGSLAIQPVTSGWLRVLCEQPRVIDSGYRIHDFSDEQPPTVNR
jgi:hypothetical protein